MEWSTMAPWLIILLGWFLIMLGIVGSVIPGIPGPPLALIPFALLPIFELYTYNTLEWIVLIVLCILVIGVAILDYILPAIMTKYFGGTKYAGWGSTLGLLACVFISTPLGPFAILVGPFVGALLGEMYSGKTWKESIKAAVGTLLGFLVGTAGKVLLCIFIAIYYLIICVFIFPTLFQ